MDYKKQPLPPEDEIIKILNAKIKKLNQEIKSLINLQFFTSLAFSLIIFLFLIKSITKGDAFLICWNSGFLVWNIFQAGEAYIELKKMRGKLYG